MDDSSLTHALSEMSPELRAKLEKKMTNPNVRERVVLLSRRHAAAGTAEERRKTLTMLESAAKVEGGRGKWWILLPVIMFLPLGYLVYNDHKVEQAMVNGIRTTARVESVHEGNCVVGVEHEECLAFTFTVHPDGRAAYFAAATQRLHTRWMSRVQPGSWLTVSVDRADPLKVWIATDAFAQPPPAPKGS